MTPTCFQATLERVEQAIEGVEGWLSRREVEFLTLLAARPTADGDVLEIGSFRGRSTIALAIGMQHSETLDDSSGSQLVAVDPMLDDDPLLRCPGAAGSARRQFDANLSRARVREFVEFHPMYSHELAPHWHRPLRLLWIDGDHSYRSTKQDFDLFSPFLSDGAVLAMHDVLSRYDGCIRVFCEDVLTSPQVSAAGLCGSIGWAQFWKNRRASPAEELHKRRLLSKLKPLLPYHCRPDSPRGLDKLRYKWLRSRVPHGAIDPQNWLRAESRRVYS
jgi:predicted O-methyltransferase YrrM